MCFAIFTNNDLHLIVFSHVRLFLRHLTSACNIFLLKDYIISYVLVNDFIGIAKWAMIVQSNKQNWKYLNFLYFFLDIVYSYYTYTDVIWLTDSYNFFKIVLIILFLLFNEAYLSSYGLIHISTYVLAPLSTFISERGNVKSENLMLN